MTNLNSPKAADGHFNRCLNVPASERTCRGRSPFIMPMRAALDEVQFLVMCPLDCSCDPLAYALAARAAAGTTLQSHGGSPKYARSRNRCSRSCCQEAFHRSAAHRVRLLHGHLPPLGLTRTQAKDQGYYWSCIIR